MNLSDNPWMPQIDHELCTGCQQCMQVCPTDALSQMEGKAALAYPERCNYCLSCEDVCPNKAIELPFLIQVQRKED